MRHGQTTSNTIHALDTALPGADLTELGREQASAVGAWLAQRSPQLYLVSSQAARAQQTAVLAAAGFRAAGGELLDCGEGSPMWQRCVGLGVGSVEDATALSLGASGELGVLPGISEIPAGDIEMRNDEDSHMAYHGVLSRWLHGDVGVRMPGGRSGAEVLGGYVPQVLAVLDAAGGRDVAVVSHGAAIRQVAAWLGDVDGEWAFTAYLANTDVVTLDAVEGDEEDAPEDAPEVAAEDTAADAAEGAVEGAVENGCADRSGNDAGAHAGADGGAAGRAELQVAVAPDVLTPDVLTPDVLTPDVARARGAFRVYEWGHCGPAPRSAGTRTN